MAYFFFYNSTDPFCQWYRSNFTDTDGVTYMCMEQYMMAEKARLFLHEGDNTDILLKIMIQTNPKEIKRLGKHIKGFKQDVWDQHKVDIVVRGNMMKFSQNKYLYNLLKSTGTKTIVEASPFDRIWGIGYRAEDALKNKDNWGENLLGKSLMMVRDKLMSTISI